MPGRGGDGGVGNGVSSWTGDSIGGGGGGGG